MTIRDLTSWALSKNSAPARDGRHPIQQLHCRMDQLWDDFFTAFDPDPKRHGYTHYGGPSVDVLENDREYRFEIELPGLTEGDVKMFVANNALTLKGDKTPVGRTAEDRRLRIERSYGSFERSFSLPIDIDEKKVSATLKDGVLTVSIAKKPSAKLAISQIRIDTGT